MKQLDPKTEYDKLPIVITSPFTGKELTKSELLSYADEPPTISYGSDYGGQLISYSDEDETEALYVVLKLWE